MSTEQPPTENTASQTQQISFQQLGLNSSLLENLTNSGYQQPTPIQAAAIPFMLAGRDVMAGARTGTGKTAAFALPILSALLGKEAVLEPLEKMPSALVLVPTRELAQQVFNSFEKYSQGCDVKSVLVYGGASTNKQIEALDGPVDVVIATPGRLLDLMNQKAVELSRVEYLVFDEADRMLDMGFSGEINRLLKKIPKQRQTCLFSATFDDEVFKLSKTLLNDPELIEVDARNTAAEKVEQMVYVLDDDRKREFLAYLIGSKNWQQVLVFVRTKQGADYLAKELGKDAIAAVAIHGDKSQGARERGLAEFKEGKVRVLIATDVAARGLDIQALQYVVNYDLPFIAEDYIHRIGRTGRAGKEGLAISLMSMGEEYLLEEIEVILGDRLPQSWYPGFEPDLTKPIKEVRKNSRSAQKKRAKNRAFGKKTGARRKK